GRGIILRERVADAQVPGITHDARVVDALSAIPTEKTAELEARERIERNVRIVTLRADQGDVREDRVRNWRVTRAASVVVTLESVRLSRRIPEVGIAKAEIELHVAAESEIGILLVVRAAESDHVLAVHRAAEPLI